ncbi:MAG: hypothetical protein ACKOEC_22035, partial [Acidimicrobiia bacterium]
EENTSPYARVPLPDEGVTQLNPKDYAVRTENSAREALARVAVSGTAKQKETVRAAVGRFWPDIGKGKTLRDLYPNSNMKD